MARNLKEIQELTRRIEALPVDDQARVLRRVLTARVELRLAVEALRTRARKAPAHTLNRALDETVREVRSARRRAPS